MKKWISRLGYGLVFALPLMLLSYALAHAEDIPQASTGSDLDCKACHQPFYDAWIAGAHGQATTDPIFQQSWKEQGEPLECLECHVTGYDPINKTWESDGINCTACHDPIPAGHPLEPMPTDRSGKMCGDCHTETFFEWQISAHRDHGLDCSGCHDPHITGLKSEDPGTLCASCHRARSSNFGHSHHSKEGLACSDCHLTRLASTGEMGHARRDHSFFVSLTACNQCHAYQMHDPVEVHPEEPTPQAVDAMVAVEAVKVSADPLPSNPMGFTLVAGLVGMAFGIAVAPWIDRIQRRFREDEDESEA